MVKPSLDPDTLTIRVAGRDPDSIPADDAIKAIQGAVRLLEELEAASNDSGDRPPTKWVIVAASMRSPLSMTIKGIRAANDHRASVAAPLIRSLRMLEDKNRRPRGFTERMLSSTSRIGRLLENGVESLSFEVPGEEPYIPTPRLSKNAEGHRRARPAHYFTDTVLEGALETINVHGSSEFYIYDRMSGDPVRCFFEKHDVSEVVSLIERRVRVHGVAKFTRDHDPVSMQVTKIEPVPEKVPSIRDLHDRKIDITGGRDSVEYVRKLRNA